MWNIHTIKESDEKERKISIPKREEWKLVWLGLAEEDEVIRLNLIEEEEETGVWEKGRK